MKLTLKLDDLRAVVADTRAANSAEEAPEMVGVQEAGSDRELVQVGFHFEGTRSELMGMARSFEAFVRRVTGSRSGASLPYDFEASTVVATEWVS